MLEKMLFWAYFTNTVVLINHEIDSAYWQEWKLINPNDNSDAKGFVLIHFPILAVLLLGLVLLDEGAMFGYIASFFLSTCGIFAFFFHFYHLRKGRPEFNNWVSKLILILTLPVSLAQAVLTVLAIL
jgi:hypothetical protein